MTKTRTILIASTVIPALLLGQISPGLAQQPGADERPHAPHGEPRQAPAAPRVEQPRQAPIAPRAEPQRQAPVAPRAEPPRQAPVAPRAEPQHQAPAAPRAELQHQAPAAPRAEPQHQAPAAPRAEPQHQAPAAPRAEPQHQAPAAPRAEPQHQAPAAPRAEPQHQAPAAPRAEPQHQAPAAPRAEPQHQAPAAPRAEPLRQAPVAPQAAPVQPRAAQPVAPSQQPGQAARPVMPVQPGQSSNPQNQPRLGQPIPNPQQSGQPQPARPIPGQQQGQGQPVQGQPGQGLPGQGPQGQRFGQPGQPGFQGQPGQPGFQGQTGQGDSRQGERRGGLSTGAAIGIGAAAGLAGGFLAATGARGIEDIRRDRRETREDGVDYIREPGRTIVRDGDRSYVVHDENERFRDLGLGLRTERRGDDNVAIYDRPEGEQILTFTDNEGRMVRRVRRYRDGREVVLIDNGYQGRVRDYRDDVVVLPPEEVRIPRDRFIVDADGADEALLYDTLIAPPVAPVPRRYTLDQVRYSPDLRARMRSVDVDTLNFDPGSWVVPADQARKLQILGEAVKKAVSKNASEVFLVEGYTDATGNPTDNLSLSDRRAQSVATILTRDFGVPPENLTTQGYGQQYLKENTQQSSRINRRVTLRRITPLLADSGAAPR